MFVLYGPNTNLGVGSIIVMIEAQVGYALDALGMRAARARRSTSGPRCRRASTRRVQERLRDSVWSSCRNWYRHEGTGRVVNNWPGFMVEYVRATRAIRPEEFREVRPPEEPLEPRPARRRRAARPDPRHRLPLAGVAPGDEAGWPSATT